MFIPSTINKICDILYIICVYTLCIPGDIKKNRLHIIYLMYDICIMTYST